MPKMKTKSAAAKRYKVTGNGHIKKARNNKRHILTKKNRKRLRHLKAGEMFAAVDEPTAKRLLPYG